jgi:small subunit ribosomal protein S1
VDDGIEGLIHVSELSDKRVNHPKEVVKEGETYQLRVIKIDSAKRRLGLSLKRVNDEELGDYEQTDAEEWNEDAVEVEQELATEAEADS